MALRRLAADARGARQGIEIGSEIEVIAHFELGVVCDVVHPLRLAPPQGSDASASEIVSMDVVGVHIVLRLQYWRAPEQTRARRAAFAIIRIDAGDAQDARCHSASCGIQNLLLGIHPAMCTRRMSLRGAALAHPIALAVAIHAGG